MMWIATIRSPLGEPAEYVLKPGRSTIGRKSDNDLPIPDESASRVHAEIQFDPKANTVTLRDLDSTNGTFVNRERISRPRRLQPDDQIRIGQHVISLSTKETGPTPSEPPKVSGTQPLTRDLLLESLDQHAVLLYEVAGRLNTVIDLDTALREVSNLLRVALGADKCEVILTEKFGQLQDLGFPTSIARLAIDQRSAVVIPDLSAQAEPAVGKSAILLRVRSVMCVPIMSGEEIAGLIYVFKTRPLARPFDQRDLQLAVAISHQAALTIQRTRLLRRIRQEQRIRQLLQRFFSAPEAEYFLQEYLQTGRLPELSEQTLTVLFSDIKDSTGLAERLGAWRFSQILGHYYQEMTEAVFAHSGLLNKYLGDGLMAVFGVTHNQANPEERAVQTALEMLNRLEALSQREGEAIEIGIGVNSGPTIAGYLGSEERIEFTVLGDTVNVAQRLQERARPNRVFVGALTREAISRNGQGQFNLRPVGPVELRGRTQPIEAFEVLRG
jgi:adenylate cyclase